MYLAQALILSQPMAGETLYMYLAVTDHAVSVVLIRVQQDVQKSIYYVSKTPLEAKINYLYLEKIALALVHETKKLTLLPSAYRDSTHKIAK